METYDLLDTKIDRLEVKFEARFSNIDTQLDILFKGQKELVEEMRAMRKEFSGK
jgi:hypothetical protein